MSEFSPHKLKKKLFCPCLTLDHVRNKEMLLIVNEQRNILHELRKRKANWIGHILRRNCPLNQVIEGKITGEMEVARRRGRRRKKLLDELQNRRGYSHLKGEALDRTMWRHCFGGGFGPVVRENTEWMMNEWCLTLRLLTIPFTKTALWRRRSTSILLVNYLRQTICLDHNR